LIIVTIVRLLGDGMDWSQFFVHLQPVIGEVNFVRFFYHQPCFDPCEIAANVHFLELLL